MSTTITPPPPVPTAPPIEKQTTVGNYFVSNYPPFSFWKPELTGEVSAAMERPPSTLNPQPSTPLGIYVHIPFCARRCDYCSFAIWTDRGHLQIEFVDAVITDESMPGASGSDLIRRMRAIRPTLPILLVSGYLGTAVIQRATV